MIHKVFPIDIDKPKIPYSPRSLDSIIDLENIDIKIRNGSFTVIIGPTGSGKSSLLNAMLGELNYLPEQILDEFSDRKRVLNDGELKYIEDYLVNSDLSDSSPVSING